MRAKECVTDLVTPFSLRRGADILCKQIVQHVALKFGGQGRETPYFVGRGTKNELLPRTRLETSDSANRPWQLTWCTVGKIKWDRTTAPHQTFSTHQSESWRTFSQHQLLPWLVGALKSRWGAQQHFLGAPAPLPNEIKSTPCKLCQA